MTKVRALSLSILLACSGLSHAKEIQVGMATGFPPYQFSEATRPTGFDYDVAQAVFNVIDGDKAPHFNQYDWDNVVSLLRYEEIDVAIGMEKTPTRTDYFLFSAPYYSRHTKLFVLADNRHLESIEDFIGKRIAGDRHSDLEHELQQDNLYDAIRIQQTDSKQIAMKMLADGKVDGVIMPEQVAHYLASQNNIHLKAVWQSQKPTPVSMALSRSNGELLAAINRALAELEDNGTLDRLREKWSFTSPSQ